MAHGVHALAWRNAARPGAHVVRLALAYLHAQAEQGTGCPLTMTHACVPALQQEPALAEVWLPRVTTLSYDARCIPAEQKTGCTIGMGMTEKQGGSDVRANTTRAHPLGAGPAQLRAGGPQVVPLRADVRRVPGAGPGARAGSPVSCCRRFRPDGSRNALRIQRLKDKLGDWSNASSEVELRGSATRWMVGEEGRGVATIIEMVALTRLDCMIGSAAIMRQALVQAIHHARHRKAFGQLLVEQPLMQNVLADLALESEAATALMLRDCPRGRRCGPVAPGGGPRAPRHRDRQVLDLQAHARLRQRSAGMPGRRGLRGGVDPAAPLPGGAAQLHLGRQRQHPVPRRAARPGPRARDAAMRSSRSWRARAAATRRWTERSSGSERSSPSRTPSSRAHGASPSAPPWPFRRPSLVRGGDHAVSDAFCQSRLGEDHGSAFGTLSTSVGFERLIERAWPS